MIMAKTEGTTTSDEQVRDETAAPPAPQFSIHPFTPTEKAKKPNIYDDAVAALIDAQNNAADGETVAITILIPTDKKARNKHLRDFRESATNHDRTARIRTENEQDDGTTAIEFTLTQKVTRQRNSSSENTPEISDAA